jgi:hypothetical protein
MPLSSEPVTWTRQGDTEYIRHSRGSAKEAKGDTSDTWWLRSHMQTECLENGDCCLLSTYCMPTTVPTLSWFSSSLSPSGDPLLASSYKQGNWVTAQKPGAVNPGRTADAEYSLQLLEERRPEAAGPWAQHAVMQACRTVLPASVTVDTWSVAVGHRWPRRTTSLWKLVMDGGGGG